MASQSSVIIYGSQRPAGDAGDLWIMFFSEGFLWVTQAGVQKEWKHVVIIQDYFPSPAFVPLQHK